MVNARRTGSHSLGQNFLVDRNILGVITRLAELSDADVILEVGGGEGILSTCLAETARFLHIIEIDRRLEPGLRAALDPHGNFALHMGDALAVDLATLTPSPNKMVANLPYSVAATLILRTIEELPSLRSWVVMVQREVGERLAATPGTAAYGIPSVLAQLACEVRVLRPISREVVRPVPNVDSVLLGLTRRGEPQVTTTVTPLVHDAFSHRRKALAGSLALARRGQPDIRERARAALLDLGLPSDVRAERLTPQQFAELAARLDP